MYTTVKLLAPETQYSESVNVLYISSKVTTPQDAHGRLVLQVYLGSHTLEFSAIRRLNLC